LKRNVRFGAKAERMRAVADYLHHAIACRELAERTTQRGDKKILEELAKAWEKIAALREQDLIETKDRNRADVR
jgi:hypothetical protein